MVAPKVSAPIPGAGKCHFIRGDMVTPEPLCEEKTWAQSQVSLEMRRERDAGRRGESQRGDGKLGETLGCWQPPRGWKRQDRVSPEPPEGARPTGPWF